MKLDVILAGVGGQGILSIAYVIDNAAMKHGWHFKQAEVHGMSQRGGAVESHLRISSDLINSDLIPVGKAGLVLGVEPMEALRYLHYLAPDGWLISSSNPYINIANYPAVEQVLAAIEAFPQHVLIDSAALAKYAGNRRAENMIMIGAAQHLFPFSAKDVEDFIAQLFADKGEKIINVNIKAFHIGMSISRFYRDCLAEHIKPAHIRVLAAHLQPDAIEPGAVAAWAEIFTAGGAVVAEALKNLKEFLPGTNATAAAVKQAMSEEPLDFTNLVKS